MTQLQPGKTYKSYLDYKCAPTPIKGFELFFQLGWLGTESALKTHRIRASNGSYDDFFVITPLVMDIQRKIISAIKNFYLLLISILTILAFVYKILSQKNCNSDAIKFGCH
jgi:hypothetical protein